jgi:hypothetical protein
MSNPCTQEGKIRKLEIEIAVAQRDISQFKTDIKDIKSDIKSINSKFDKVFWFALVTVISVLGQIVFSIIVKK